MSAFEFAFTLFGLVLGLAMAEILAGFARVLKARSAAPGTGPEATRHIRIGWLTPAIATVVTYDLITSWLMAWQSRDAIPINMFTLAGGTLATAIYFIAASMVWPDDPAEWPDLDAWFDRHKGQIGGAIVLANLGFTTVDLLTGGTRIPVWQFVYVGLAGALIFTRRRWQSAVAVGGLLAAWREWWRQRDGEDRWPLRIEAIF